MSLTSHTHTRSLTLSLAHARRIPLSLSPTALHTGAPAGNSREGQGPIRLAREGATGSSGKYWVGLGWRREIISEPCSRYPKTKHTLGEKVTVVMYQSQVPMRQAPCTCRGPAAPARYPVGPARVHPAVPRTWQYLAARSTAPPSCSVLGSRHGGDPLSPGAVLRCRRAHRPQHSVRPLRETSGWSSCHHGTAPHTRAHTQTHTRGTVPTGIIPLPRTVTMCLCECECERESVIVYVYENASSLMATPVPRPASQPVESVFLSLSLSSSSSLNKHRPHPGRFVSASSLPGLSCPGVGNYEDDFAAHFVMLSLTYEFWAIFQNFSQGGHLPAPAGVWGCSPGARGVPICFKTDQPPTPTSKLLVRDYCTSCRTRLSLPFWECRS